MPDVPCPYSTFLMGSAWYINLEVLVYVYASGVSFKNSVIDAHVGSTEGDNNDGITFFDITDPADPSYCFVSTAYDPVPEGTGKEKKGVKEDVLKKINALRNERLMTLDALAEAQSPFPDSAMPLLTKIVQHEGEKKSLDRSSFSLSNRQFISLLTSTGAESVELLNLSHNPITTDTSPAVEPPAWHLSVFTPATVLRCLTDLLGRIADLDVYEYFGLLETSLVPQDALATGVHEEGQPWSECRVHRFPAFSN
ncbi:hypothetical protein K438DRAFT_1990863 [Mycena galopus ATCC 62051]|nr:hypothetical protein K438DRAFT_1990863 [Mycena galopus ATCC 62051]